jgi:hypothetical protein
MKPKVRLGDFIGDKLEEDFSDFDLSEIQEVLEALETDDAIDLSHAEQLQQKALRGADILTEYLGKIIKTVGYLESKINSVKNAESLAYKAPDGSKTTTDMKIWAGNSSPEVEKISIALSKARASKMVLEKKYDILVRSHHHYKDIAAGLRRTILGYSVKSNSNIPEGYD